MAKFPTQPGDGSYGSSLATVLGAGAGGGAPMAGTTLVLHFFKL